MFFSKDCIENISLFSTYCTEFCYKDSPYYQKNEYQLDICDAASALLYVSEKIEDINNSTNNLFDDSEWWL